MTSLLRTREASRLLGYGARTDGGGAVNGVAEEAGNGLGEDAAVNQLDEEALGDWKGMRWVIPYMGMGDGYDVSVSFYT